MTYQEAVKKNSPAIVPTGPQNTIRQEDVIFSTVMGILETTADVLGKRSDQVKLMAAGIKNYADLEKEIRLISNKHSRLTSDARSICTTTFFLIQSKIKNNENS